jgi:hypothetical protein
MDEQRERTSRPLLSHARGGLGRLTAWGSGTTGSSEAERWGVGLAVRRRDSLPVGSRLAFADMPLSLERGFACRMGERPGGRLAWGTPWAEGFRQPVPRRVSASWAS